MKGYSHRDHIEITKGKSSEKSDYFSYIINVL